VANNLNDISKDHPALAIAVCRRWMEGASKDREWIVNHALRVLVKQGHPEALSVIGFAGKPKVRIQNPQFSAEAVRIGETLRFSFELVSEAAKKQELLVDYAVHYVKANGKTSPKVFKLSTVALPSRGKATLRASLSFREMTTRKHYPGIHRLEALVNGVAFPLGSVDLGPA
jgi:hypothetical protein